MKKAPIVVGILALASLAILGGAIAQDKPSAPVTPPKPRQAAPSATPATPSSPAAQAAPTAPPAPSAPAAKSPASFQQIKSLLGEWEGKLPDGKSASLTYRLVSSGTAVMETMNPSDAQDMVTIYYPDGDRLMLTHYCASNNQPRMRTDAGSTDPKQLIFSYVDATNLGGSKEGVMTGLTVTFVDADHFTQTWTWMDKIGGTPSTVTFPYSRKK